MTEISNKEFKNLVEFVRETYGINLENKRQLINARLSFYISRSGYNGFSDYLANVLSHPDSEECRRMINRLSTNYTYFFREPEYIEHLAKRILPEFVSAGKTHIKIWCSACSSGQEAYSVAMVLEDYRALYGHWLEYEIFCTDINTELIETAKKAEYSQEELPAIPERYRRYIFKNTGNVFKISNTICSKITWKYENLLDSLYKHAEFDIVFCRNVMIYFTPELRKQLTEKLYYMMKDNGYLFCGATESIDLERKYFQHLEPSFYKKHSLR